MGNGGCSHIDSAPPSSSVGGHDTLFPCPSVRSLPRKTILQQLLQTKFFTCAAGFVMLLQHGLFQGVQLLPLTGHFNQLDVYWKSNTTGLIEKQCRGFLECIEGNFLIKFLHKQTGEDQTWCSLAHQSSLEMLRLVAAWAVLTMPWLTYDLEEQDLAYSKVRTQNFRPCLLEQRSSSSPCFESKTRQARTQ